MKEKITAEELVKDFYKYVNSNPKNKKRKWLSYGHGRKLLMPILAIPWNEVKKNEKIIKKWIRDYSGTKKLSDKTVYLTWCWLARSYEYGVMKGKINKNPFKGVLPEPRSGSYID